LVHYDGPLSRDRVLAEASRAHVGLALMPMTSTDMNMRYMAGASNKPFDYMAAGIALLVSDLSDWRAIFVEAGFARSCNTSDENSIRLALQWFIDHPEERIAMAARARQKILADWNYDTAFKPVLRSLESV
jgi:spore maturation protein CgeB